MAIHTQTKKTKTKKNKTQHSASDPLSLGCAILVFCFFFLFFVFLVFWFLGFLVFWFFGLCVDSPDLAHGSELLFFFIFSGFLEVLAKLQKTIEKPKKKQQKQKVQTHVPCQASPQTLPMGLNFLFFPIVVLHVFHVKMLHHSTSQKNARLYNLHTCAPQAKLQKKNMEKTKFV